MFSEICNHKYWNWFLHIKIYHKLQKEKIGSGEQVWGKFIGPQRVIVAYEHLNKQKNSLDRKRFETKLAVDTRRFGNKHNIQERLNKDRKRFGAKLLHKNMHMVNLFIFQ